MHITFVGFGWEQLGLSQLSAIARANGHSVDLAFSAGLFDDRYNLNIPILAKLFCEDKQVVKEIERQQPDVLVCSPLTATYQWSARIVKQAKEVVPTVRTIFGGVHVSAVPERVIQNQDIDYVCVGEGDVAFLAILNEIQNKEYKAIPSVWYRNQEGEVIRGSAAPFFQDLDSLPFFDKELWEGVMSYKDIYVTIASRGCPYKCTYCFNNHYAGLGSGKYIRYRSPEHVIKELKLAKERYRPRLIEFEDDVFTLNRAWLKTLMDLYIKEINIPFQCLTHPNCMDDDIAKTLKEAGCRYVQMGIQTMDDDYRHRVLRRPETQQNIERALKSMQDVGLKAKIDHMFGLPDEPLDAQEKALKVYRRYPPYRMQTFWISHFPETAMMDYVYQKGLISPEERDAIYDGRDFDDFRNSTQVADPQVCHTYKAYECLFKLLTVMPRSWAKRMEIKGFLRLPNAVLSLVSFSSDLISGLVKSNPDHWKYAKHYLFHMWRVVRLKCFPHARSRQRN